MNAIISWLKMIMQGIKRKMTWYYGLIILILLLMIGSCIIFRTELLLFLPTYPSSNTRNALEIIYFATTPVLLVVAALGLKQLSISRQVAKTNAKRESFKLAAEQCSYFLQHIIPKMNTVDKLAKEKSIKSYGVAEIEIRGDELNVKVKKNVKDQEKIKEMIGEILDLLNALEGFSVFFTNGIAEQRIAFSSIGFTYCNCVKKYLPLICPVLGLGFNNIIKLYIEWNTILEKQKAWEDKIKAEEKLSQDCVFDFKTIGT